MYEYSYLYATLSVGIFWGFFFLIRPDLRPTMLIISFLFGIGGLLSEFVYAGDWWDPVTLTGTTVGIEDFLFGFFFSGSVAVCYEVIFIRGYEKREHTPKWPVRFRYIALITCTVFFGSTLVFMLHSFVATVLAFGICIVLILSLRKDLINNAVTGSLFSCIMAFTFFGVPEWINSGWVKATWSFHNLSGIFVLHVPLEDFIWFAMAGAFIAPLHKFWKNNRSIALSEQKNS
ncbi:hypothetical protein MMIC_P0855 [Mariprofundus micogutta]|uniref:Lycopene cyclase domain-containing protein n=1 Tax=Mariprofundus micogutta TaxID=1921010 RepID=A0A1L8CLV2_9PROT|nr:lycopene cyclase domain-containing protein [Mariprofundus micogutta]GAV19897.1 hypothetical protein MMIC_P0855 [Mariprofundus micogutta]